MIYFTSLALLLVVSCNGQRIASVIIQPPASNPLSSPEQRDAVCANRNGYFKINDSCDSYVECKDYRAINRICPDGLNFSPNVHWPQYPCRYPTEASCLGRGTVQPPQATLECPHQYGIYPSEKSVAGQCGQYKMCVAGKAVYMDCPRGLVFNPAVAQCDWPESVPSCNVNVFARFQCPPAPLDQFGTPSNIVQNYKHESICYKFYSCQFGRARLLSCDHGLGFDPTVGHCVQAELVQCYQEDDLI